MAEYVNGSVIYCRHKSCWQLNVIYNKWKKVRFMRQQNQISKISIKNSRSEVFKFNEIELLQCPWEIK